MPGIAASQPKSGLCNLVLPARLCRFVSATARTCDSCPRRALNKSRPSATLPLHIIPTHRVGWHSRREAVVVFCRSFFASLSLHPLIVFCLRRPILLSQALKTQSLCASTSLATIHSFFGVPAPAASRPFVVHPSSPSGREIFFFSRIPPGSTFSFEPVALAHAIGSGSHFAFTIDTKVSEAGPLLSHRVTGWLP